MTKAEAAVLVANLVTAFPSARFGEENASMYESGIADLGAQETQAAIGELIHSSRYLPSIAEIRAEVMRLRRLRESEHEAARRLRLNRDDGSRIGPRPESWQPSLTRLLESSARHARLSEAWFSRLGKPAPKDPGLVFVEIAKAGVSGENVTDRAREAVFGGDMEEQDRRHP